MARTLITASLGPLLALTAIAATAQPQDARGGNQSGTPATSGASAAANPLAAQPDANSTRLFFGPTGRSLGAGEGYIGVYQVLLPFVQVGVTDRVTLGGGTPLFFGGGSRHPFWVTPKVQVFRGPGAEVAAGVMHFFNVSDEGGGQGIAYAVGTFGTPDRAITVGAGWAYSRFDEQDDNAAVGMVGGEYRVGSRIKVITENYVFDGGGIVCAGVRFLGDHLSADFGLASPVGMGETFVFPMVNFVWRFGRSGEPAARPAASR